MPKFRLKAAEVDAEQFTPKPTASDGDEFRAHQLPWRIRVDGRGTYLQLQPVQGPEITIRPGDWILKTAQGEFTAVPQARFAALYEAAG